LTQKNTIQAVKDSSPLYRFRKFVPNQVGFCACYGHLDFGGCTDRNGKSRRGGVPRPVQPRHAAALHVVGTSLLKQNSFPEATPYLLQGEELMRLLGGRSETFSRERCLLALIELFERWGVSEPGTEKRAEADDWRGMLEDFTAALPAY
jgi:hypothetical protein